MLRYVFVVCWLVFQLQSNAQSDPFVVRSWSLQAGVSQNFSVPISYSHIPDFIGYLPIDTAGSNKQINSYSWLRYTNNNPFLKLDADMPITPFGIWNVFVNLGVDYQRISPVTCRYSVEEIISQDTLVSLTDGQQWTLDSSVTQVTEMKLNYHMISISAALLLRRDSGRRFIFYAGPGASIGMSVLNRVAILQYGYSTETITKLNDSENGYKMIHGFFDNDYLEKVQSPWLNTISIQGGFEYRFVRAEGYFWKRSLLFYSFNWMRNNLHLPEYGLIRLNSVQHGIGIRTNFK